MNVRQRALISVFDKTGIVDMAQALLAAGFELLSTGGTAKLLRDQGLAVTDVADVTGQAEIMGACQKPASQDPWRYFGAVGQSRRPGRNGARCDRPNHDGSGKSLSV